MNQSTTKDHDFYLLMGAQFVCHFMTSRTKQLVHAFKQGGEDKREFSRYFFLPDVKVG
jgi:serpin B